MQDYPVYFEALSFLLHVYERQFLKEVIVDIFAEFPHFRAVVPTCSRGWLLPRLGSQSGNLLRRRFTLHTRRP